MQSPTNRLTSIATFVMGAVFTLGLLTPVQAQEKKADGTWAWTMPGRNGGPERKLVLKLKTEGDKLTGTLTSPSRDGGTSDTKIQDGKIKGEEISFTVTREFNGNKMTSKYKGKLTSDAIKGKIEFERNGEAQSRDWEAKRATEKK
jgi:hypothetical protein